MNCAESQITGSPPLLSDLDILCEMEHKGQVGIIGFRSLLALWLLPLDLKKAGATQTKTSPLKQHDAGERVYLSQQCCHILKEKFLRLLFLCTHCLHRLSHMYLSGAVRMGELAIISDYQLQTLKKGRTFLLTWK